MCQLNFIAYGSGIADVDRTDVEKRDAGKGRKESTKRNGRKIKRVAIGSQFIHACRSADVDVDVTIVMLLKTSID